MHLLLLYLQWAFTRVKILVILVFDLKYLAPTLNSLIENLYLTKFQECESVMFACRQMFAQRLEYINLQGDFTRRTRFFFSHDNPNLKGIFYYETIINSNV